MFDWRYPAVSANENILSFFVLFFCKKIDKFRRKYEAPWNIELVHRVLKQMTRTQLFGATFTGWKTETRMHARTHTHVHMRGCTCTHMPMHMRMRTLSL